MINDLASVILRLETILVQYGFSGEFTLSLPAEEKPKLEYHALQLCDYETKVQVNDVHVCGHRIKFEANHETP